MGKSTSRGFNKHLSRVKPLTENQLKVFDSFADGYNLLLSGPAGTGKTFIALYLAIKDALQGNINHIVIVRSAVPTREIGYLPGTLEEKQRVYEIPYMAICSELFNDRDAYLYLQKHEILDFMTTSFVRGITLENSIIIMDEIQNYNFHEIDSILTRLGNNSRVIMCGDFYQCDFNSKAKAKEYSGIKPMINITSRMESFRMVEFDIEDVVRSDFVKEYLSIKKQLEI